MRRCETREVAPNSRKEKLFRYHDRKFNGISGILDLRSWFVRNVVSVNVRDERRTCMASATGNIFSFCFGRRKFLTPDGSEKILSSRWGSNSRPCEAGSSSDVGEKAAGPKKLGLYRQTARWKSSMFHESNYNVSPALYAVINNNQTGNCRMILWKQKKEKWSWTWGKKCNFVHIVISSWKRNDNASIEASFVWRLLESPLSNSIYIEINQFSVLLNKYDSIEFCQKGLFLCCSQCRVCFSTQSQAGLKATVEKWLAF